MSNHFEAPKFIKLAAGITTLSVMLLYTACSQTSANEPTPTPTPQPGASVLLSRETTDAVGPFRITRKYNYAEVKRLSSEGNIFLMRSAVQGSKGLLEGVGIMREKGCQISSTDQITSDGGSPTIKVTVSNGADCLPEVK